MEQAAAGKSAVYVMQRVASVQALALGSRKVFVLPCRRMYALGVPIHGYRLPQYGLGGDFREADKRIEMLICPSLEATCTMQGEAEAWWRWVERPGGRDLVTGAGGRYANDVLCRPPP